MVQGRKEGHQSECMETKEKLNVFQFRCCDSHIFQSEALSLFGLILSWHLVLQQKTTKTSKKKRHLSLLALLCQFTQGPGLWNLLWLLSTGSSGGSFVAHLQAPNSLERNAPFTIVGVCVSKNTLFVFVFPFFVVLAQKCQNQDTNKLCS